VNGHVIVVDLGYGDAGKGTIVDWLCARSAQSQSPAQSSRCAPGTRGAHARPVQTVVRFNGGAQAAHHVLARGGERGGERGSGHSARHRGEPHAFAQFGSGTFTLGTRTFLSRFMLVDPLALVAEAEHLERLGVPDPFGLVAVDRDALLTTPYHRAANQAREEARGDGRHGSCGMGIGETASYAIEHPEAAPRAGDIASRRTLIAKLGKLRDRLPVGNVPVPPADDIADVYRAVAERLTLTGDGYLKRLLRQGPVVFEGAQGVLLDEWRGFHPYTTWSTTTFANAETLLGESGDAAGATRLGVTRAYQTRHGPGPFPTEDPTLAIPEPHNANGRWQGPFRTGHLDAVALGYAAAVAGGVDAVALTHLDTARRHAGVFKICRAYDVHGRTVSRIEPGPPRDLEYQESLTAMLLQARPVYDETAPDTEDDWADAVAGILRAPLVIGSHGPALTDKTWRPAQVLTIGLRVCPIRFSTPPRRPQPAMAVTATLPLLTDELTWTSRSRRSLAAPATAPTRSSFSRLPTPPVSTARCAWSRAASTPRSATPR
jgi:adenylosuccinate synthase